jgi:hypothetical protein
MTDKPADVVIMDIDDVLYTHSVDAHYAQQPLYFEPEFRRGF